MTRASDFWDGQAVDPTCPMWTDDAQVRDYINRAIGGDEPCWPLEWFVRELRGRRFARALSIGCGTGMFERSLAALDVCDRIDAFDGAVGAVAVARREASSGEPVRYFVADFNRVALPLATYDAVFFHQSLHHVNKLERLLREVLRALKPDGLLYIDEYVGPSVLDWNDETIAPHRAVYASLPADVRVADPLPYPIVPDDPSEAIRSAEILEQLRIGFEPVAHRDYGGNLLSILIPNIRRDPDVVRDLIERERVLLAGGAQSYYTVAVHRPKSGNAARLARLRWMVAPKLRRIRYELFARIGRPRKF